MKAARMIDVDKRYSSYKRKNHLKIFKQRINFYDIHMITKSLIQQIVSQQ
ncbi:hypothetical protein BACUNI_00013 [Bacteroides uniformis ATCC 8492]|uniref:Transposase n=1 Tax=Bacteroides uniformis (strain ATCC 8492 / DSM 6597 / CCUG 4942 / CIP 103695 / JCM 5828 / KCTC 5204 / NCTC 13054 / VPI 0061) TaxID=411479 RepID=A0ABC9NHP8_BACUC|nr:hypothetical protein BACUNI_00013 [Bacteroides uniformis ATCC 8492]